MSMMHAYLYEENPMVIGDYYEDDTSDKLERLDTKHARYEYIAEKGLEYKAAACGLCVESHHRDGIRDWLEAAFHLACDECPEMADAWVEEFVEMYSDDYHYWLLVNSY